MRFQPFPSEVVLYCPDRKGYLHFQRPETILSTHRLEDVPAILSEVDHQVNCRDRFAAGFLSYEAAPAFDEAFRVTTLGESAFPLLWFGLYAQPELLSPQIIQLEDNLTSGPWRPNLTRPDYVRAIQQVKEHIACGETYQVNYTYRLHAPFSQPAWPFFAALAGSHAAPYAAFLETDEWALCSISPELFFTLDGETLTSRPMKGTAPRGLMLEDDGELADWLYHSEKNRAENVMIVDMVRNDMGRIARTGSVRVPQLFQVEKYPTVWQMTSTVQAETKASFFEILQALFPAASITGAPKIRTMQIITALETGLRRIYTGTVGYLAPGRAAQFNVAIRTLLVDKPNQRAEYGVGGGIVWDSSPTEEWHETIAKTPIDSNDRFLYHKTTRREVYDKALSACPGCDDVLLWNERGEVTEACIANLVVELDGMLYTPSLESGVLPGTYRAWLLQQGKVKERRIDLDELERCTRLYLVNSVRGMWEVEISLTSGRFLFRRF